MPTPLRHSGSRRPWCSPRTGRLATAPRRPRRPQKQRSVSRSRSSDRIRMRTEPRSPSSTTRSTSSREVALAHLSARGKPPSESVTRRVRALLRNAVADEDARNELARGLLREEVESAGFGAFAGVTPPRPRRAARTDAAETRRKRDEEKRRERERALRDELDDAEQVLATARGAERDATRARETAERAVEELRGRLERSAGD